MQKKTLIQNFANKTVIQNFANNDIADNIAVIRLLIWSKKAGLHYFFQLTCLIVLLSLTAMICVKNIDTNAKT